MSERENPDLPPEEILIGKEIKNAFSPRFVIENFVIPPPSNPREFAKYLTKGLPFIAIMGGTAIGIGFGFDKLNQVADIQDGRIVGLELLTTLIIPYTIGITSQAIAKKHVNFFKD